MKILLITPPFTQLNTPYPATAYLKSLLNREGYQCEQIDLGNLVIRKLFSSEGLNRVYEHLDSKYEQGEYGQLDRFFALKGQYLTTIDTVSSFLQGYNNGAAYRIINSRWLPEGDRLENWEQGESAQDDARHRATLYLEEIGDIISAYCDDSFGFSRYAERLALSPPHFAPIKEELSKPSLIREMSREILKERIDQIQPDLCGFSVPFPGNLMAALDGAGFIKDKYPDTKIVFGGGYINTELRGLKDRDFFEFADYVTLDDGERPLLNICRFIQGEIERDGLVRTFYLNDEGNVEISSGNEGDFRLDDLPAPDYRGLMDQPYFSLLPVTNSMHRLWSDGKWNKMTLAHGCYWHRCAFCDTSLDYIKRYDPSKAVLIAEKMKKVIEQTGIFSFHFVDEAAPPALLKELAIELIRRNLSVSWWTNIRFEKSFTPDLCRLLAKSGCIAVSGGLEVASDQLLDKIDKGVTVSQVSAVSGAFSAAGIMVHAYLMYGFPGQTEQEIVDALENVRQLFEAGLLDSAFWHQFALTAHSPVGLNPRDFGVVISGPEIGDFARNDLEYTEERDFDPSDYGQGLRNAILSYMTGRGLNEPLRNWFPFRIPKPRVKRDFIRKVMDHQEQTKEIRDNTRLLWTGSQLTWNQGYIEFHDTDSAERVAAEKSQWFFLSELLKMCHIRGHEKVTVKGLETHCDSSSVDVDEFLSSPLFAKLSAYGLLML